MGARVCRQNDPGQLAVVLAAAFLATSTRVNSLGSLGRLGLREAGCRWNLATANRAVSTRDSDVLAGEPEEATMLRDAA